MRALGLISAIALVLGSACSGGGAQAPAPGANTANAAPKTEANDAAPAPGKPAPPESSVPQAQAEYVSFEGGLRVYVRQRRAEMHAVLLGSQSRPLEFLVVAPGGATHESLFATGVKGEYLKRALEMIQLKEGETKRVGRGYTDAPLGDKVKISVRFKHLKTGVETVVPVEEWLWDTKLNARPEASGWVFTGSFEQYDPKLNRSLIESDMKGNLIAVWRDASCVVDNGRKNGATPDCYSPNPDAAGIPDAGSEVTLIFEPFKE